MRSADVASIVKATEFIQIFLFLKQKDAVAI